MPIGRILLLILTVVLVAAGGNALAGGTETPREGHKRFAERLAAELSLPAERVREALQTVRKRHRGERRAMRAERRAKRAERRRLRAERRGSGAVRRDGSGSRAERRKARAERRAHRAERRKARAERRARRGELRGRRPALRAIRRFTRLRDRLAPDLSAELALEPAKVTAALRTLLGQRLDRAVARGRLTPAGRDAALACFDDASKCQGLRARLRHS